MTSIEFKKFKENDINQVRVLITNVITCYKMQLRKILSTVLSKVFKISVKISIKSSN